MQFEICNLNPQGSQTVRSTIEICLFDLRFYVPVNSHGPVEMVSY